MNLPNPNVTARFIAEVQHVTEVTLAAEADGAYWQDRLSGEAVFPFQQNGKAHIVISATELHSMGKRTHELTIGLIVCERPAADSPDALYLVHAFNSSRLFAWIERTFFSTPYYLGRIQLDAQLPIKIRLEDRAGLLANIQMTAPATPAASSDELWQGRIFLPSRQAPKYFVARLGGYTDSYPYLPSKDVIEFGTRPEYPVFQWLRESQLRGKEWRIYHDATHARSKTYLKN